MVFNEVTTGAANDLERATDIAREMVMRYGMSDALGPLTFGTKHEGIFLGKALSESRNYSEDVAARIDAEIRRIIDQCYERAKSIIAENQEVLDHISRVLVERETLGGEEFKQMMDELGGAGAPAAPPETPPSTLELQQEGAS